MDRLKWLKERQKGIGGSDVGAIMGVNKYKIPFQVYLEKTEEITEEDEGSGSAYCGSALEELVAREFTLRTGKKVRRSNKHLVHKEYPFMVGNIDRKVLGENAILECKTTSAFNMKAWESEEIPESYILQCQHYMAVTGAEKCYIAVLIGGQKFMFNEILRDDELISMIIEVEKDFWINHVEKRIPPPIDGSEACSRYLKDRYEIGDSSMQVDLKSDYEEKISKYISLKENIKALEEQSKALESLIKNELGVAERGAVSKYIIFWKSVAANMVDSNY